MREPVRNHKVTSPYGMRIHPVTGIQSMHNGIDFVSQDNYPAVYSILAGKVIYDFDGYDDSKRWTSKKHSAGNMLIIESLIDGLVHYVRYLHLIENYARAHSVIEQGSLIGKYGDVGISHGSHLHLDIYDKDWQIIDPTFILSQLDKVN